MNLWCFLVVSVFFSFLSLSSFIPTASARSPTTAFHFCGECRSDIKDFLEALPNDPSVLYIYFNFKRFRFVFGLFPFLFFFCSFFSVQSILTQLILSNISHLFSFFVKIRIFFFLTFPLKMSFFCSCHGFFFVEFSVLTKILK